MKKILLCVENESTDDNAAVSFFAELTHTQRQRILDLASLVRKNGAFEMQLLGSFGSFSSEFVSTDDIQSDSFNLDETCERIVDNEVRSDCATLHVRAESFYFSAQPKHSSDYEVFKTASLSIDEMLSIATVFSESNQQVITLPSNRA